MFYGEIKQVKYFVNRGRHSRILGGKMMKHSRLAKNIQRALRGLALAGLVLACPLGISVAGAVNEEAQVLEHVHGVHDKELKVSFYYLPGINMKDDNGKLDGYNYELFQRMGLYCSGKYTFVGYERSLPETFADVDSGAVDMMPCVAKTPEREAKYLFTEKSVGVAATSITARADDERFLKGELPKNEVYKIGLLSASYRNEVFAKKAEEDGIKYIPVYFGTIKEMERALQKQEVDLLVSNNMRSTKSERIIEQFAYRDFYIIFNKKNMALKKHIDEIIEAMDNANPTWRSDIFSSRNMKAFTEGLNLTAAEEDYFAKLRASGRVLKVLPNPNRAPLSKWNGKQFEGIMVDSFAEMARRLGVKYEFLLVRTREDFDKAWQGDKADIVLGLYEDYQMPYTNYNLTSPYLKMELATLYRREAEGNIKSFAMLKSYPGKMANIFLNAKPYGAKSVVYPNSDMCMEAVLKGDVDATAIFTYAAQQELLLDNRNTLAMRVIPESEIGICLGIAKHENHYLGSGFQKAVMSVRNGYVKQHVLDKMDYTRKDMTLMDYLHNRPVEGLAILAFVLLAGFAYYLNFRKANTARLIEEKNAQLEENQSTIISLQKALNCGMWEIDYDKKGNVTRVNFSEEFREIFDLQDRSIWPDAPDLWLKRLHPDDRTIARTNLDSVVNGEGEEYAIPYRVLNGKNEYRWVRGRAHALLRKDGTVKRIIGFSVDVTSDYETDFLTGKLTGAGFNKAVERYLADKTDRTVYSLLYFNIRNFKAINSLWGFDVGDSILKTFSDMLAKSSLQPLFLGRKGDHFLAFVEKSEDLFAKIEKLSDFTYETENGSFAVHAVCGVYNPFKLTTKVDGMVDRAKLACDYIDNEYTQPYAVFDNTMRKKYVDDSFAIAELDRAIAQEELKVYYQPIVECRTGKVASAEALVRWQHPEKGMLGPNLFVPALEAKGFISKLDRYVMEHVSALYHRHLDGNLPLVPVSVNYSWMDFYDKELIAWVTQSIKDTHIPNKLIRAEVTESSYSALHSNVKGLLDLIQENKISLVLDDFGTGVASLDMLQQYAFNLLKIDKSFTDKLETNPRTASMVKTVIDMCHLLGIKVIAEGVENKNELDFYRENSCDYIQGYYFYKPMPEEEFEALLLEQEKINGLVDYNTEKEFVPHSYYKSYVYYPTKEMQTRANKAADSILSLIGDNTGVGSISGCYDAGLSICYFSNLLCELFGYTQEEFLETSKGSYLNMIYPEDRGSYLKSDSMVRYYRVLDNEGKPIYVKEMRNNVRNRDGELQWIASIRKLDSITDEELERIAETRRVSDKDSFTGLLTKNAFFAKVDELLAANPHMPCSMIILDMDNFKEVNDVCGHIRGDEVLLAVAKLLKQTFRSGDLVGRFGGDEFMVFLKNSSNEELVRERVEAIMKEAAEKIYYAKLQRRCTLCAGAFCTEDAPLGRERIFEQADRALYKAKASGKDQLVFAEK